MAKIMTVNAGSSSLKFMLVDTNGENVICDGLVERIGIGESVFSMKVNGEKFKEVSDIKDHAHAVELLLKHLVEQKAIASLEEIDACGHRFVHGGEIFTDSVKIDQKVLDQFAPLVELAPLHNPANLTGYESFKKALAKVEHVAVWDTAFHSTMEDEQFVYPTPYSWYEKYGVRRYGFHGTSHKFVSQEAKKLMKNEKAKIIVAHLGNGASVCAVNEKGESIATSMGFTPLAGIMMGTRSGDIDPAIVSFIAEKEKLDAAGVINLLNKNSGYLGVSGVSSDARDVEDGVKEGNKQCVIARKLFARRTADYIGQYFVALGGADAIIFTAGAGENDINLRTMIMDRIGKALGMELDAKANDSRGKVVEITKASSKVKAFVIPTNEEIMIARDTKRILGL